MATPVKPYEVALDAELAKDILNIPLPDDQEDLPPARTVGERVQRAVDAVEMANRFLARSPMARIVAEALMKQQKKRGYPSLRVLSDGTMVLRVSYEPPAEEVENTSAVKKRSMLPKLNALREEADELGVDISDLKPRARRAIFDRIEQHKKKLKGQEARSSGRLVDEVKETEPQGDRPKVIRRRRTDEAAPTP